MKLEEVNRSIIWVEIFGFLDKSRGFVMELGEALSSVKSGELWANGFWDNLRRLGEQGSKMHQM